MIGSVGANSSHSIPNSIEPVTDESNSSPSVEGRGSVEYMLDLGCTKAEKELMHRDNYEVWYLLVTGISSLQHYSSLYISLGWHK